MERYTRNRKRGVMAALAAWTIGTACLGSCTPPNAPVPNAPAPAAGTGSVRLSIDTRAPSQGRAVLGNAQSANLANVYEALFLNESTLVTSLVDPADPACIPLEPGNYTVLVLAGTRRSPTSTTALLLGSYCHPGPVTITAGATSTVSVVLKPVDFSFSCTDPCVSGQVMTITAAGNTRNACLGMSLSGSSTSLYPRMKSTLLWNGYHAFDEVSGTETAWSASCSVAVPMIGGEIDLQLHGAQLTLVNCGSHSGSLAGKTDFSWKWLNRYDLADDSPLASLTTLTRTIQPPSNGLQMGISWE
jgi:hypothetical protein